MTKNMTLRVPEELARRLRIAAAEQGCSQHALILRVLEEQLDKWAREAEADKSPILVQPPIPEGSGNAADFGKPLDKEESCPSGE